MEHYLLRPLCMLVRNILLDIYMYLEIYLDIDGISTRSIFWLVENYLVLGETYSNTRGNSQREWSLIGFTSKIA